MCISTVGVRKDLFQRDPYQVPITDFFGSVRPVEITSTLINATAITKINEDKPIMDRKNKIKYKYVPQMPHFDTFIKQKT